MFDLPPELIARHPAPRRDASRLMVIDRASGHIEHAHFHELGRWITPEDLLVLNDSKVLPARLTDPEGQLEILLLEETSPGYWTCIGRPAKRLRPGAEVEMFGGEGHQPIRIKILRSLADGTRVIRLPDQLDLNKVGQLPLPPYILKARQAHGEAVWSEQDRENYQTVYARAPGSVAAPTAGLHFTPELLSRFSHAFITLHVGLGTFRPIKTHHIEDHEMHREVFHIPEGLAARAAAARRVVAVGTTSLRVLESRPGLKPGHGQTRLFIRPGFRFQRTGALITNFHLPGSTLIILVAAFMGLELQRRAYAEAIRERYRFFSYGDAMLIL